MIENLEAVANTVRVRSWKDKAENTAILKETREALFG